ASAGGNLALETTGAIRPYVSWRSLHDVVREEFSLSPALRIPAGPYRSVTGTLGVATTFPALVLLDAQYSATSGFFGGARHSLSQRLSAPLGKHVLVVENATAAWVRIAGKAELLYVLNG